MVRIRLARRGRRNLNSFAVVAAEQKFRRDGRFIEKLGYYQPLLKDDDQFRLHINKERYDHWLKQGAQPSDKVKYLAAKSGAGEMFAMPIRVKKALPKAKAIERTKAVELAKAGAEL